MKFVEATKHCLQNYANFSGRASRSEYWFFFLFYILAMITGTLLDNILLGGNGVFNTLATLGLVLPGIAVGVRRLHDLGKSGWWYLLVLLPLIGSLVLLFWFVQKGQDSTNDFGANPLAGATA